MVFYYFTQVLPDCASYESGLFHDEEEKRSAMEAWRKRACAYMDGELARAGIRPKRARVASCHNLAALDNVLRQVAGGIGLSLYQAPMEWMEETTLLSWPYMHVSNDCGPENMCAPSWMAYQEETISRKRSGGISPSFVGQLRLVVHSCS